LREEKGDKGMGRGGDGEMGRWGGGERGRWGEIQLPITNAQYSITNF
jgi:hypothetical protein